MEGCTKGQLISKANYGLLTSPKKRTDEFVLFAFLLFTANKSNSFVHFLGESTACQSAFWFHLTCRYSSTIYLSCDNLESYNNLISFFYYFQANITLEEYSLMYKVYQKSVRQTETFKDLQRIKEETQKIDMNEMIFSIKPSGNLIHK